MKSFLMLGIFLAGIAAQSAFAANDNGTGRTCHFVIKARGGDGQWNCDAAGFTSGQIDFPGQSCTNKSDCKDLTPPPTPAVYDDCDPNTNCGLVITKSHFDFNIKAGGTDSNLYVCQVGFLDTHCGPNCGGHYMDIFTAGGKIVLTAADGLKVFTSAQHAESANLYLNDLNEDAGFYVKYCLDVKRLVVGASGQAPTPNSFTLVDKLTLTTGNGYELNGTAGNHLYFDATKLRTVILKSCGASTVGQPLTVQYLSTLTSPYKVIDDLLFSADNQGVLDFIPETLTLPGTYNAATDTTCFSGHCEWTVVFKEMNECLPRAIDCLDGTCGSAREAKIYTDMQATLDFCKDC